MKPTTLDQRIKAARRVIASWSPEKRRSMQLQGSSVWLTAAERAQKKALK